MFRLQVFPSGAARLLAEGSQEQDHVITNVGQEEHFWRLAATEERAALIEGLPLLQREHGDAGHWHFCITSLIGTGCAGAGDHRDVAFSTSANRDNNYDDVDRVLAAAQPRIQIGW
jgi:hypothetical protein